MAVLVLRTSMKLTDLMMLSSTPLCFGKAKIAITFSLSKLILLPIKAKKISVQDFYAYRIMVRVRNYNHILRFKNLFNQFLVYIYMPKLRQRLNFIKFNQKKLRSEVYIHLQDAIRNNDGQDVRQMMILPTSFT